MLKRFYRSVAKEASNLFTIVPHPALTQLHTERLEGLNALRMALKRDRYASVDHETMKRWLNADLMFRGTNVEAAWNPFAQIWDQTISQTAFEAQDKKIYEYKKVFHSSYDIEGNEEGTPIRQQNDIIIDEDGIPRQKYLVHELTSTGGEATDHYARFYPSLPLKCNNDPVLTAVHRLFAEIYMEHHQKEMGIVSPVGRNMFQFCYRTIMRYVDGKMVGDPGPEGVHVDGGTAVMIFVVNRDNIMPETGGTRIWSMDKTTGKPTQEDLVSDKVLKTWKPLESCDALFFLDESVMHEALRAELIDPNLLATRDMLILDLRRDDGSWHPRMDVKKGE